MAGPVDITLRFFDSLSGGTQLGPSLDFPAVPLAEGTYHITMELSEATATAIFGKRSEPVYLEVTAAGKVYPRQWYAYAPYALRVPVDGKTIAVDHSGALTLAAGGAAGSGKFLTQDASGALLWVSPQPSAWAIQGQPVSSLTPTLGQVLGYDGTQWLPQTLTNPTGSVTQLTAAAPLTVAQGSSSPTLTLPAATATADGYITSNDWIRFKGMLPLNGGTMSGALDLGGNTLTGLAAPSAASDAVTKGYADTSAAAALRTDGSVPLGGAWAVGGKAITATGNLTFSANKTLGFGAFDSASEATLLATLNASGTASPDVGRVWYNSQSKRLRYWDGSGAQTLATTGTGITSLDGATGGSQTFSVSSSGTAPAITPGANNHVFSFPLAAGAGVTAGLVSNSNYLAFGTKQGAGNYISSLTGDVVASGPGSTGATVASVGGSTAAQVHAAEGLAHAATAAATPSTLVLRDGSGGFAAGTISANLSGTATVAMLAATSLSTDTLTGAFLGDVTGSQGNTVVAKVGTSTAANIHLAEVAANGATPNAVGSSLVLRDTAGGFSSGLLTATSPAAASQPLIVKGAASQSAALQEWQASTGLVLAAVDASGAFKLKDHDGTDNYLSLTANSAMTADLIYTLPGTVTAGAFLAVDGSGTMSWSTPTSVSGAFSGDIGGTQTATTVNFVGGVGAGTAAAAAAVANAAAAANTTSTLVKRDGSGNLSAGTVTASLTGNVTGNATGNASGSVSGTAGSVSGIVQPANGGKGVANGASATHTIVGSYPLSLTLAGTTIVTLPTSGTLATVSGVESLSNKTLTGTVLSGDALTGATAIAVTTDITTTAKMGSGTSALLNTLDVLGGTAIGTYAGVTTAPTNGLLVSGNVGIGTSVPAGSLDVNGSICLSETSCISSWPVARWTAASGNLSYSGGNVGIGSASPASALDVQGVYRIKANSTLPAACTAALAGTTATNGGFTACICDGVSWMSLPGASQACNWDGSGSQAFTTPGTYTWYAPVGVTSISVVAVGGGGGVNYHQGGGGGGGGLCYKNNITVTPGTGYTVVVGLAQSGAVGGSSSFNGATMTAYGGGVATGSTGGAGGGGAASGGTCFTGGSGGSQLNGDYLYNAGGGGAAGYGGNGGNGGNGNGAAVTSNQTAGSGGGGGGGGGASGTANHTTANYDFLLLGGGGGGVGLYGVGANGAAGASSTGEGTGQGIGGAGSGGLAAPYGLGGGGQYGGGASGGFALPGGGAVRIIWGPGKSFPNSAN